MGAFFLYKNNANLDLAAVRAVFAKKGFATPNELEFGGWRLLLYRKQLISAENILREADTGCVICSVGTPIYRGKSYAESLKLLLRDFKTDSVDQTQLLGSCCILFWDGHEIKGLTDRQNTLHVFYDGRKQYLSTSFLACVAASPGKLPINRLVLCEKLSTGYITSPDTLVDGINCHDDVNDPWCREDGFSWIAHPTFKDETKEALSRNLCIEKQAAALKSHFSNLNALAEEYGGELGFSDGLDSRLVLACAKFSTPIALHTHATAGGHERSRALVKKIVDGEGLSIREIPTRQMYSHTPEEVADILKDGLYYFDARNGDSLGAFSETHTRAYRKKVLADNLFSLNGIGGEIYRNYGMRPHRPLPFKHWADLELFVKFAQETVGSQDLFNSMRLKLFAKMLKRIGPTQKDGYADLHWQRKYFCNIRMPDCRAIICDAHNQLQYFHTPFLDRALNETAMSITKHIGNYCEFEADLITLINPKLASYDSGYGFPFDNYPLKQRVIAWAKSHAPSNWLYNCRKEKKRKYEGAASQKYIEMAKNMACLKADRELMLDVKALIDFDLALIDQKQRPSVIMVAEFLREFESKIRF